MYMIQMFRPHTMSEGEMAELAEWVREPFEWYAQESTTAEIIDLLEGKGDSYVDLVLKDGVPCGFLASETSVQGKYTVCYHIGVSILEADWGKGIYRRLTERSLKRASHDYLVARTQNPTIYEALQRNAKNGHIYPTNGVKPPQHVVDIARALCGFDSFEEDTLIVRDAHGFVRPDRSYMQARTPELEAFFHENLGKDDGFMVVAALK